MSIFTENRSPGAAPYHALGLWHPVGKLASAAYFPSASERRVLRGKARFQYVFNFAPLAAGGVANDRISVLSDFYWTDTIGNMLSGGVDVNSISSISLFETTGKQRYSNLQESFLNFAFNGTYGKQTQIFERRISKIKAGATLLMRFQNSANVTLSAQIVLGGYVD
jgi:hypothetical protein